MKIERGVMVVKDGRGWGVGENDGYSTYQGWMNMESADIHSPKYCRKPTDVTYANSPFIEDLKDAKLVTVERITQVYVKD